MVPWGSEGIARGGRIAQHDRPHAPSAGGLNDVDLALLDLECVQSRKDDRVSMHALLVSYPTRRPSRHDELCVLRIHVL